MKKIECEGVGNNDGFFELEVKASPKERVVMCSFTERELKLLLNSAHERGMRLLDLSGRMSQVGFVNSAGIEPTIEDIRSVDKGYKEHLALIDKIRSFKDT